MVNIIVWPASRAILVIKAAVYVQVLLVAIKLDNPDLLKWGETLLVFLMIWFTCISLLLGILFFLALRLCFFRRAFQGYKYYGLWFISLNGLCLLLLTSLPLSSEKQFNHILLSTPFLCFVSLLVNFVNFCYENRCRNEILLFFCSIQEVKAFNQIINLIRMEEEKMIRKFTKKGENWYEPQSECSVEKSVVGNGMEKCLICLEVDPVMLWMPCGHLSVCENCAGKLIQSRSINCILCKTIPEDIYEIELGEKE